MLNFEEILNQYPSNLRIYERSILKEYLQYKILEILFESSFAKKLCFLGGTCLRIVFQNTRFSEDLDFDNFKLTISEFQTISQLLKKKLEIEGFEIEIKNVFKNAFHCYIKFPKLLYKNKLSNFEEEKILIQLDTESQGFDFTPKIFIINKFDVFTTILYTPTDILLSQKIDETFLI